MRSLVAAVDELCEADPAGLGDPDVLADLYSQISRLESVASRATAAFDASKAWQADGAKSAAAWLARTTHQAYATIRRRLRLGRRVAEMPAVLAAWQAGEIDTAHVAMLDEARNQRAEDAFARDEKMLVGFARELRFADFRRSLAYWSQHADPDGSEDAAAGQRDRREAHLSETLDGRWVGKQSFDPISGAIVSGELRRLEQMLFEDDWKEATARLGRTPLVSELRRTAPQRRADAYVEMAARSATAPANGRRPAPLFTIFVGYETFNDRICQLASGSPVTPGSLLPYLDDAYIERVVFDGPSRVIDVGVQRRLFDGATRRAIQVRDHECFHDYCDTPSDQCQNRPHPALRRRRAHHPDQRPPRLRLPQPQPQPQRRGGRRRRAATTMPTTLRNE